MRLVPILILLFLICEGSAVPADFVGTLIKTTDSNIMYVNITDSRISGLSGVTEIILPQPIEHLQYFQGKTLNFEILGHDILGRLICDAYLDGIIIQDYWRYLTGCYYECDYWSYEYGYRPCNCQYLEYYSPQCCYTYP